MRAMIPFGHVAALAVYDTCLDAGVTCVRIRNTLTVRNARALRHYGLNDQHTHPVGAVLASWQRASGSGVGRWLFARAVCRRAPYFGTIKPFFLELAPGVCRVGMRKRRRVENHIHTLHALAMGNLCELAAGMATEVTIPPSMRWIPRGMTIEYLRKAETGVIATARLTKSEWIGGAESVGVPVTVVDESGTEVVRAVITMYVTPRK